MSKKSSGGSYRSPVEQPDTLQSTQIVTIVDAISEGPIEGLVDGDKSIALNYTPLRTPEGTLTYQNVSWDSRLGTPDQEAYTDIPGAEAEQSVGAGVYCRVLRWVDDTAGPPEVDAVIRRRIRRADWKRGIL